MYQLHYQSKEVEQLAKILKELEHLYGNLDTLLTTLSNVEKIVSTIPVYASDAAAVADTNFPSGNFYTITGSTVIHVKP